MGLEDQYVMNQRGKADHRLRCELLAAAKGEDREAAITALQSLGRIYHLRLPLVEARLGIVAHGTNEDPYGLAVGQQL